jgi:hypothetical protein
MFSFKARTAVAIGIALSLVPAAFSQKAQSAQTPAPQATASRAPDYVDFSGFKGKVFDVKHRDPHVLWEALRTLGSGFKGATISWSDEFKTLTVRDFPENIAAIEEALKRLDTPQPPVPDIEILMHVLIASNAEGAPDDLPASLKEVVAQLRSTLNFKGYHALTTIVQRTRAGTRSIEGNGAVGVRIALADKDELAQYSYRLFAAGDAAASITPNPSGGFTVQIPDMFFSLSSPSLGGARIETGVSVRDGEKVVVGTSSLKDRGLILVLSARVIKP